MVTVVHEVFGTVEFDEDGFNEWESETRWAGGVVDLDLTFDGAVDTSTLDELARYVTELAAFDQKARAAIRADFATEESAVRDYVEHHLELFGVDDPGAVSAETFMSALRLVRVGLYHDTEDSEHEATFDYTIDREKTQYLVVVNFGEGGAVGDVSMES